MGFAVSRAVLAADVPVGGSFAVQYPPSGYTAASATSSGTLFTGGGNKYENVPVSNSGTALLVTNTSGRVLRAGESITLEVFQGDGSLRSGQWIRVSGMFRLAMSGTGSVTVDARGADGSLTLGAESYTLTNAAGRVEFPFVGERVVEIRATFPTTAYVEVI